MFPNAVSDSGEVILSDLCLLLAEEIADLKGKLTSVKSKAIPDHYQEKEEVVKGYDADDRDLYGRVIR